MPFDTVRRVNPWNGLPYRAIVVVREGVPPRVTAVGGSVPSDADHALSDAWQGLLADLAQCYGVPSVVDAAVYDRWLEPLR